MIVADVWSDSKEATGYTDDALVYSRISDAVEVLSNKGDFDALTGYATIKADGNLITLPPEIEVPVKVSIDGNPSFARDKYYEFTMNGPGPDADRVGWSWEDKGLVPVFRQPDPGTTLIASGPAGAVVKIGYRNGGAENHVSLAMGASSPPVTTVTSVAKLVTTGIVTIIDSNSNLVVALGPNTTDSALRQIRISKPGATCYIMYRKTRFRVSAQTDIIPIRSKMGLIYMIRALQAYRDDRVDVGTALETQALKLATEEQTSHNAFVDVAKSTENAPILDLNYNNIDSIIASDIYDDACKIVGPIGRQHVFDKITEALSILSRKAQWDSLRGYVDIVTDQYSYVTLPRYVESVIRLNINGRPTEMRNKWFQFHLDGPGDDWATCGSWEDVGEVATLRDAPYTVQLTAVPDSPSDDGKIIWVYGSFRGKRVATWGEDGTVVDGMPITIQSDGEALGPVEIDIIERITKPQTDGFVRLIAQDTAGLESFLVGYYYPDETEPKYRRIKLPRGCETVRIMYRKRHLKITALTDPIHLRSKTAILTELRALDALEKGDVASAEAFEMKAVKYLLEENAINNQGEDWSLEADDDWSYARQYVPFA